MLKCGRLLLLLLLLLVVVVVVVVVVMVTGLGGVQRVWLQTELDDAKFCYQLIITLTKFVT